MSYAHLSRTTPRPVYLEEEGRYFPCRLYRYGTQADGVYEQIRKGITAFWLDSFLSLLEELRMKRKFHSLVGISEEEMKGKVSFLYLLRLHSFVNQFFYQPRRKLERNYSHCGLSMFGR